MVKCVQSVYLVVSEFLLVLSKGDLETIDDLVSFEMGHLLALE